MGHVFYLVNMNKYIFSTLQKNYSHLRPKSLFFFFSSAVLTFHVSSFSSGQLPSEDEFALLRLNDCNLYSSAGFCSGYYHMIISDGQLASKMFRYERARWDLISTLSLRAAAQAHSAQGNCISITGVGVNKATLKEREGATGKRDKLVSCERVIATLLI